MSWLFSQALVAEYSAGTSLDGVPCAQLNVMPTPHKFWRNDKTMEFSKLSQFGLTLQLLTVDHGAELLMSYLAVSRAKTSAQPVQVLVSRENEAGYGPNSNALLAKYDPISSMWKTAQCSLFEDLELSLETWPNWGSMRNGESFQRQIPTLPTYENASGSWPTPNARDWKGPPGTACMERGGAAVIATCSGQEVAYAVREREQRIVAGIADAQDWREPCERSDRPRGHGFGRWPVEPGMGRVADGVANRVDRIKALGNGQVPRVAAAAWRLLA